MIPTPRIPSWDEFFLRHVYLAASKSKDPRTKIGAVLVKDNVIISEGYNGFARGVKDLPERYENRELKYDFVVHAEHNSVLNCLRHGVMTVGSILYTQGHPCHECAKAIIQAGVSEIVVHGQWPEMNHVEKWVKSMEIAKMMLDESGIPVRKFYICLGIVGFMDGKEIYV